jgi:hypothetical protein
VPDRGCPPQARQPGRQHDQPVIGERRIKPSATRHWPLAQARSGAPGAGIAPGRASLPPSIPRAAGRLPGGTCSARPGKPGKAARAWSRAPGRAPPASSGTPAASAWRGAPAACVPAGPSVSCPILRDFYGYIGRDQASVPCVAARLVPGVRGRGGRPPGTRVHEDASCVHRRKSPARASSPASSGSARKAISGVLRALRGARSGGITPGKCPSGTRRHASKTSRNA